MTNPTIARARAGKGRGHLGRSRLARAVALGILLGGACAVPVQAAQSVWTGALSDDWADDGNWVLPPASGNFVLIDALAPHAAHLRTFADVGTLTVGGQAQGELVVEAGGDLTVTGYDGYGVGLVLGDQAGSAGTVTVTGAGAHLVVDEAVQIGNDGEGTLAILDGATAELAMHGMYTEVGIGAGYAEGAKGSGAGHVVVDGAGSTLMHAGGMNILQGTLVISNGGRVVSVARAEDYDMAPAWVDEVGASLTDNSSVAVATVTGEGSAWDSRNGLQIAYGGTGTLNVLDGASATFAGFAYVGNRSALFGPDYHPTGEYLYGNGTLLVSGQGSTFTLNAGELGDGRLYVGSYGTGRMTVADGAAASIAGVAIVGGNAGATGTLEVDDGGFTRISGIDANGMGLIVGDAAGSNGVVTVSGAGSVLNVDAGAQIGNAGTGSLSVTNGGAAVIGLDHAYTEIVMGLGYYGWGADVAQGRGTLLVDGAGSTLGYAGGLNVLAGSVTVSDGGVLASFDRVADGSATWLDMIGFGVPADPDPEHDFDGLRGVASVTITGEGSRWHSINALDIGDGGDGKLSVLAGGEASFDDIVRVGGQSYLYDSPTGSPVPGLDPQAGTGAIVVSGAGSTFDARNRAIIGDRAKAKGSLTVTAGGATTVGGADVNGFGLVVGNIAGSTGSVTVDGTGSKLTVDAGAQVGNAGAGSLTVSGGARASVGLGQAFSEVVVGFGNYGWANGGESGKGTVVVKGAGSRLDYAGGFNVLSGTATVSGGGKLVGNKRAADGTALWTDTIGFGLPKNPDGSYAGFQRSGAVTITGAGSAWTSVNGLNVGYGANGSLSILDGASASFAGYAELGKLSYLYDSPTGSPLPDVPGIAGAGTLLVSGAGSSFTLAAIPGNTTWGTGVLEVGSEGAGTATVSSGGTLSAAGGIKVGALGKVVVGGRQSGAATAPGTLDTPKVTLADPAATLAFDHNAGAYDFAPVIAGNGKVDVVSGFTRLVGDSSAFAGDTTVESGAILSVNGSLGGAVGVDGRLQGTGTVGHVTVHDGGTLAPGNSPGTLHIDGDLVMEGGSLYDAEIDGDSGASDAVVVGGNVTIQDGTTLSVTNIGGTPLTPGTNLQLITTTGGGTIDGTFDTVTGSSDFLDLGLTYDGGKIVVDVARSESVTFASVAGPGYAGVGAALDGMPDDNPLTALVFEQLTTADEARAALPAMAGTMHADLRRAMLDGSRQPRAAVASRFGREAGGAEGWIRASSASAGMDAAVGGGADVDFRGTMAGYDAPVGASRFGVAVGLGHGQYGAGDGAAAADMREHQLALYGATPLAGWRLGYGLVFARGTAKTDRRYDIGTEEQRLRGKRDTEARQLFADLGYRVGEADGHYLEPFLSLANVRVRDGDLVEEGSVAALEVEGDDVDATFATAGVRWSVGGGTARFAGSLGWQHAFGFDQATARQAFVEGGPSFSIDSAPLRRNATRIELGASFTLSPRANLWAGYDGLLSSGGDDHGFNMQLSLGF